MGFTLLVSVYSNGWVKAKVHKVHYSKCSFLVADLYYHTCERSF